MMHKNSLEAWENEVKPTLTQREQDVLDELKKLVLATCEETANSMGRYPNQISGRFTALKEKGAIKEMATKLVRGRQHSIYRAV